MNAIIKIVLDYVLLNPYEAIAVVAVLGKIVFNKFASEAQHAKAKAILGDIVRVSSEVQTVKSRISEATDQTKLTTPQVADIVSELKGGDSNKKKIQRAARKILRGWIFG